MPTELLLNSCVVPPVPAFLTGRGTVLNIRIRLEVKSFEPRSRFLADGKNVKVLRLFSGGRGWT